jgi:branched-chain amino acid transport system permease protein
VVATILVVKLLWSSRFGRIWRGIEEADDLAESIGINILNYKILIFAVSCFFAGAAGSFYAHYYRFLSPVDFGIWQSIYPLVYLQVGGIATIAGPVVGAIVLTVLPELFRSLTVYQPMIFGGFILITMLLFPPGLIGIPRLLLARKERKEADLTK